jgi:hypothetical protein
MIQATTPLTRAECTLGFRERLLDRIALGDRFGDVAAAHYEAAVSTITGQSDRIGKLHSSRTFRMNFLGAGQWHADACIVGRYCPIGKSERSIGAAQRFRQCFE